MILSLEMYGFRFAEDKVLALCRLFAASHEIVDSPSYNWDGQERIGGFHRLHFVDQQAKAIAGFPFSWIS